MGNKGFSLIEILLSLILLSIILLGFEAMAFSVNQTAQANYYFAVAENQMTNLYERIQTVHTQMQLTQQLTLWQRQNIKLLPHSVSEFMAHDKVYIAQLFWGKKISACTHNQLGVSGCIRQQITLPKLSA
jgi:prepilin-type N-terminal cleavage/methylation domain-containing protein